VETPAQLKEFLSGIAIFGGLSDPTLERVLAILKREDFPQGAVVVEEGECGHSMYVVRSGAVVLYQRGPGLHRVQLAQLGAGECFGEMARIDMPKRSATVVAEVAAVLYSLTNRDLYQLYLADMPGYVMLIQNLCRELSRRLRRADARITEVASLAGDESVQIPAPARK